MCAHGNVRRQAVHVSWLCDKGQGQVTFTNVYHTIHTLTGDGFPTIPPTADLRLRHMNTHCFQLGFIHTDRCIYKVCGVSVSTIAMHRRCNTVAFLSRVSVAILSLPLCQHRSSVVSLLNILAQ